MARGDQRERDRAKKQARLAKEGNSAKKESYHIDYLMVSHCCILYSGNAIVCDTFLSANIIF